MSKVLTLRQQAVYNFIIQALQDSGYPPTRAEIASALGFRSPNAAEEHLKALKRKGFIEMIPGASRGLRVNQKLISRSETSSEENQLAIIGQVAAGYPILASEHIEGYCPLPCDYFNPCADYLLRVKGTSMQNVGILDGDLLAVHRQNQARNGQIVVARIHDEVTVKRFYQNDAEITLKAENPEFSELKFDLRQHEISIEGIAVGLIRTQQGHNLFG